MTYDMINYLSVYPWWFPLSCFLGSPWISNWNIDEAAASCIMIRTQKGSQKDIQNIMCAMVQTLISYGKLPKYVGVVIKQSRFIDLLAEFQWLDGPPEHINTMSRPWHAWFLFTTWGIKTKCPSRFRQCRASHFPVQCPTLPRYSQFFNLLVCLIATMTYGYL